MTGRKAILATLKHEELDIIPQQTSFFDINGLKKFVPNFSNDWKENAIKRLEFIDSSFVEVSNSLHQSKFLQEANDLERIAFYHAVAPSGGLYVETIKEDEDSIIIKFETGGRWEIHKNPFWRNFVYYPIKNLKDLDKIKIPDPNDPKRYEGVEENTKYFKRKGLFTQAEINGFFSGIWYRYYNMPDFMVNIIVNEEFIKKVVDMVAEFNLGVAENFLRRGVDSIMFCDDLGSNTGLLISPDSYKKFFYPWHKKLTELCHKYGAYLNMHSHGNINKIVPLLVEAGIDILNPVGPSDNMNLKELKAKYGNKITFMGGISKFIGKMNREELDRHLKEVIETGSPGGGFMLMSEGGIPSSMSNEDFKFYLEMSKKYRKRR